MIKLRTSSGDTITATPNHPIWNATDQEYQDAQAFETGDRVTTKDGDTAIITLVDREGVTGTAWNLTVDGIPTYHIGEDGILVHNTGPTVPGCNGALRSVSSGRFAVNPATVRKVKSSTHGNRRDSPAQTWLYRLLKDDDTLLKWGITSQERGRYTKKYLADKQYVVETYGSRNDMLNLERWIVERYRGPLNFDAWAGKFS